MSKKHKKVSTILYFIQHVFMLASAITGYFSVPDFAFLLGIPLGIPTGITSSE